MVFCVCARPPVYTCLAVHFGLVLERGEILALHSSVAAGPGRRTWSRAGVEKASGEWVVREDEAFVLGWGMAEPGEEGWGRCLLTAQELS